MAPSLVVQAEESTSAFFGASITALTGTPWNLQASHIFPAYVSIASAAVLFVNFLVASKYTRPVFTRLGLFAKGAGEDAVEETSSEGHIQAHGGRVIFTFEVFTAIGCIGLLWVALLRAFAFEGPQRDDLIVAAIPFAYTSLLALFSVVYPRSTIASSHVPLVLAASWIIYFIRDLIPLMTYTEIPLDPLYMLWELIALLSFTGVILPVVKPRQYVPFDPSDPMPPNPSQTASILSLAIFQYLDPTVWLAYRVPHLPLTDLPPLADSDHSKHLIRAAFPHLDPFAEVNLGDGKGSTHKKEKRPPRSMILGVLTVFRKDVIVAALLLLLNNAFAIANPYGLKKLLEYLETNGEGANIRPWVWIASLFIIPFTSTLLLQQYSMILARASIHLTAVLTQLILQHALRIRIIAEAKSDSAIGASKAPSIADSGLSSPPESEATAVASESEASKANPGDTGSANAKSLVGRMNNLISSDLEAITKASEFLQVFIAAPVMIIFCVAFLYTILGWSALVGFGVMLAMMPVPIAFSKMLQSASKEVSKKSDDRVETVTETMSVIRMVKMFGWETKMAERIDEKREIELSWVWWNKIFSLLAMNFNFIIPAVTMCVTFSVYALVMKGTLNASIVFASISLFDILRFRTHMIFLWVPMVIKGGVSLQRIHDFLYDTELLDEFTDDPSTQEALLNLDSHRDEIGFASASFSWSNEDSNLLGTLTPSKRRFRLHIENELLFKRGAFNLIIGPTGSGKTSLLMALLGEMHFVPTGPGAWFNLPRGGGVAYSAQESWVLNATIKDNILFGAPFDEERYKKVIYQCSLTRDLELFKAGDLTEVGEKGLTLSGGQKARITLARAIYSSAEILLLDDVLAALDVHTAKWIVDKCFVGDLVQGRTVLLVTHNVSLTAPISDFVVSLGVDGQILSQGTSVSDALAKNAKLEAEVAQEMKNEEKHKQNDKEKVEGADSGAAGPGDAQAEEQKRMEEEGKLVLEEESGEGHISWGSVKMYLVAMGGKHWVFFWTAFSSATVFECGVEVLQPWLLGAWATEYMTHLPEEVNVGFYLTGYVLLVCLMLAVFCVAQTTLTFGALRASASLHRRLMERILGTTLRWLDKTPTSRVITRVTQDVAAVDTTIPDLFSHLFELGTILTVRFLAILIYTPTVGSFALVIFVVGGAVGNVYMKAQLNVKREMSKAKAPVVAHFGAVVEGIASIRAYGAQDDILLKSLAKVDHYSRAARVFNDFARWIGVRVDALGGCFAGLLGAYFVYHPDSGVSASNSAFTLTLAVGFGRMVLQFVQVLNMFEVNGNSLERLQEYMAIEQEGSPLALADSPSPSPSLPPRTTPASWPTSGALTISHLSARYAPTSPNVLHDLSFSVRAGERVGVVGRTGSGKSSLGLALLGLVVLGGGSRVEIDGVDVFGSGDEDAGDTGREGREGGVGLERLRSAVTIIPQVPELLSGSVRRNLDPFGVLDDATLNAALRDAGLGALQSASASASPEDGDGDGDDNRLTLDSAVARGGSNLSVGQRQIVALARAMVRESKVLILDEATSAIDYKTDTAIQKSLRTNLSKDVTVLTVAHRLQTIMDSDKIMVLDAGKIVEFDAPEVLLGKGDGEGGYFKKLVDESGDRERLYEAARTRPGRAGP